MSLTDSIFDEPPDAAKPLPIVIPYSPRPHILPIHNSTKRFQFAVMHRRAGKTVGLVNQILKKALENPRQHPPPRYAYIGPSFAQAKDLVWGYLKHYTSTLPGVRFSEGELHATLPTGAQINLYGGSSAYERMRGVYFDGAVLDEFSMLNPASWSSVVRPCLADYKGWAVIAGTSNGDDHFHEAKLRAERQPETWDVHVVPVTRTDALDPDEVIEMTKDMTSAEYAREMLCDFSAPIEGSYYAEIMNELKLQEHITEVPWQPEASVTTWWDLGIDDDTVIWFVQRIGKSLHVIDYYANSGTGKGLEFYANICKSKPYTYGAHVLPHDVKVREMGIAMSRYEMLMNLLGDIVICPYHLLDDGIPATRAMLRQCYFDEKKCAPGLSSLSNYHRLPSGRPDHNWASHASDALRIGAMSMNLVQGMSGSNVLPFSGPLRRRIKRNRI
jgi:phage terminase large subunit